MNLQRLSDHADRVVAVALVVLGFVVLAFGWFGVSGTGLTSEQMSYIVSGGLGGICLVAVGSALWLSADLRDEWTKLDRIERVLHENWHAVQRTSSADSAGTTASPTEDVNPQVTASPDAIDASVHGDYPIAYETVELPAVGSRNGDSQASA